MVVIALTFRSHADKRQTRDFTDLGPDFRLRNVLSIIVRQIMSREARPKLGPGPPADDLSTSAAATASAARRRGGRVPRAPEGAGYDCERGLDATVDHFVSLT